MTLRFIDIWVTCPDRETAEKIAAACIDAKLAACANIFSPIVSQFRWQDAVERDEEVPLLLKTRAELFEIISDTIRQMHPYEVPAIVATELSHIDRDYADWLRRETREPA